MSTWTGRRVILLTAPFSGRQKRRFPAYATRMRYAERDVPVFEAAAETAELNDVVADSPEFLATSSRELLEQQWHQSRLEIFPPDRRDATTVKGQRMRRQPRGQNSAEPLSLGTVVAKRRSHRIEQQVLTALQAALLELDAPPREGRSPFGNLPLLTARQERVLGVLVRSAVPLWKTEAQLKAANERTPPLRDLAAACHIAPERAQRILYEGKQAKRLMIRYNIRLVHFCALSYRERSSEIYGDLIMEGIGPKGLERAVVGFDPRRGVRFSTYAVPWIRQAMQRCMALESSALLLPITARRAVAKLSKAMYALSLRYVTTDAEIAALAQKAQLSERQVKKYLKLLYRPVSLDQSSPRRDGSGGEVLLDQIADPGIDEMERLRQERIRQQLQLALSTLDPTEREVLALRYGLEDFSGRTLVEIGRQFDLTPERIRQIEEKAKRKIRKLWKKVLIEEDLL